MEVLTQNPCLRMGTGGFPKEVWVCVTRREEMDAGTQRMDVSSLGLG